MKSKCISCKKEAGTGSASFKCPSCSNFQITRCRHCREIAARYVCLECAFSGPN